MSQTQRIHATVNTEIKAQATVALANIGLTVSDAVRMLLAGVARDKAMPLALLTPNPTTLAALEEARERNLPRFDSIEALMADLHAED